MTEGLAWLGSVTLFAAVMSATPGPNNAMVAASGANFGFARTVPHMAGIALGFPAMLFAVSWGAGDVLQRAPGLQAALKWAGIAYLLWLAWRIARARPGDDTGPSTARPLGFIGAALFQWVNPKAWIIALGVVAAFTAGEATATRSVLLAVIFAVVTAPVVAFWTLTGVGAARVLRTERGLRAFNLAMAALLVLSLVPIVLE